ncbi:hypothetical protein ACFWPX_24980 [Nocardia sp. NPDC058518]|uniref:hypothetical protein n=1 Tax=Nocardia sp. NPDC058518 TaxID=3346534 RepID=UPI00366857D7
MGDPGAALIMAAPLTTVELVRAYLALEEDGAAADETYLAATVSAVVSRVATWLEPLAAGAEWPDHVRHGATMLAARVWKRRGTPSGVETQGDFGAFYVQRTDPDIAMLLGLGNHLPPKVG